MTSQSDVVRLPGCPRRAVRWLAAANQARRRSTPRRVWQLASVLDADHCRRDEYGMADEDRDLLAVLVRMKDTSGKVGLWVSWNTACLKKLKLRWDS
jgi:hypothetical protein